MIGKPEVIQVNGMAHVILTVSRFDAALGFYDRLLPFLGLEQVFVRGPQAGDWAPGYYYLLFEDPDKIRLEICHVPGSGVLARDASFNPGSGF